MLKSVKVDGFKALRGTELSLESNGLTVLLGPNGSGKSSLFGALSAIGRLALEGANFLRPTKDFTRLVTDGDAHGTIRLASQTSIPGESPIDWVIGIKNRNGQLAIGEELSSSGTQVAHRVDNSIQVGSNKPGWGDAAETLCSGAKKFGQYPTGSPEMDRMFSIATKVADSAAPVRIVRLSPDAISEPVPIGAPVGPDGRGLPAHLNLLSTTRRSVFGEIEDRFREFFPWVDEIEVPALPTTRSESVLAEEYRYGRLAPDSPEVQLNFRERGAKVAFPASEMASGMLISLALLWLVLRPEADKIICYDEPENSIHPYLLAKVYSLLRGAARGELGRPPVQVLIATHSVDFVNLCEPNEIRICERSDEGIKVTSISDEKDLAEAVNNYRGAMGELWNSGALGGVPHGAKSSRSG